MPTITKRAENTWLVRIFLGRDAQGKQRFLNKTIHGRKRDAERWAREQETALDLGELNRAADRRTLKEHIADWLATKRGAIARRSLDDYQAVARLHLGALAEKPLDAITHADLSKLLAALRDQGLSPRVQRRVHLVLSATFKLVHTRGQLRGNPMAFIKAPRNERQITIHVFTQAQARAFLAAAAGTKYATLWHLALETGLRPEEYYALRWADLDLDRAELHVRRALIYHYDGTWEFSDKLKTKKARRTVALSPALVAALGQQRAQVAAQQQQAGDAWQAHDLVFPNGVGAPLDQNSMRNRHFRPLLKAARLELKTRPYDLRHSCASLLLAAGVNPKVVSARLGHSSVAFTLDTYAHVLPHEQSAATGTLAAILTAED